MNSRFRAGRFAPIRLSIPTPCQVQVGISSGADSLRSALRPGQTNIGNIFSRINLDTKEERKTPVVPTPPGAEKEKEAGVNTVSSS